MSRQLARAPKLTHHRGRPGVQRQPLCQSGRGFGSKVVRQQPEVRERALPRR